MIIITDLTNLIFYFNLLRFNKWLALYLFSAAGIYFKNKNKSLKNIIKSIVWIYAKFYANNATYFESK